MTATSTRTRRTRPVKPVGEAVRERETFKYNPSLVENFRYSSDGRVYPSSELMTASDSVLTALALLGAYQTKTERAFISLFDSNHQYIIAEAAPAIPITSRFPSDDCSIPLALCGTAIPRTQGTCDHVLYLKNQDSDDDEELPISFVPNLATDSRFSSRPYCQFGDGGQFYAGVPIRTQRGINIGAYCVMNPTVPDGWDDVCTRRLRDISNSIMEHLECYRSKQSYWRSERLTRGLSSLMEGKATLAEWQSREEPESPFMVHGKLNRALEVDEQHIQRKRPDSDVKSELTTRPKHLTLQNPSTAVPPIATLVDGPVAGPETNFADPVGSVDMYHTVNKPHIARQPESTKVLGLDSDGSSRVYSNAANIIREAFEVEGCLFFDVPFSSHEASLRFGRRENKDNLDGDGSTSKQSSTSSSDEHVQISPSTTPDESCNLLGYSTTNASIVNGADSISATDIRLSRKHLSKLLRRYPNGKIFNFDAVGELQSSDSSEDDDVLGNNKVDESLLPSGDTSVKPNATKSQTNVKRHHQLKEGAMIHEAFPFARSVAFIPVWDWKRERWFAGGFVYTLSPSRVLSVDEELSILWAFARVIATEVLTAETVREDTAKSDALGSLSHELRSPLHGVILGTELLNDTDLTVFQENTTRTIETCCRTLLDTIDHLLDYSKVNSLAARRKQRDETIPPQLRRAARTDQFGKKSLYSNIRLDALVEEVAESIFAGFHFQQMSIHQLSDSDKFNYKRTSISALNRQDALQTQEQLVPNMNDANEQQLQSSNIAVYLSIDPTCNWMFYMQAGAIRRIVMNLLGNALKYTIGGSIRISLTQSLSNSKRSETQRVVRLTVQDTGKGISEDFMQHKLFKPFSQEDELAPGTGLGLSLVKKITSQLQGEINVESQVGVGTSVAVKLPLELPRLSSDSPLELVQDEKIFKGQISELTGLRVRIFGFESETDREQRTLVEDICRLWLHLELVSDHLTTPDIVLWSESALPELEDQTEQLAKTPNVVICPNAITAYQRSIMYENAGCGRVFEFISQPIGPRKLAKSMLLTYRRWMGLGLPSALHSAQRPSVSRVGSAYIGQPRTTEVAAIEPVVPTRPVAETTKTEMLLMKSNPVASSQSHIKLSTVCTDKEAQLECRNYSDHDGKILIVDDNHINLTILSVYMGKLGRAYETATNGKEAVDAYTRQPNHFKAILMDISMPVMDGLEATRRIRTYGQKNQLPAVTILALTGLSSESTHQEALSSGVDVFLTKPVRLKALSEVLESLRIFAPTTDV